MVVSWSSMASCCHGGGDGQCGREEWFRQFLPLKTVEVLRHDCKSELLGRECNKLNNDDHFNLSRNFCCVILLANKNVLDQLSVRL